MEGEEGEREGEVEETPKRDIKNYGKKMFRKVEYLYNVHLQ